MYLTPLNTHLRTAISAPLGRRAISPSTPSLSVRAYNYAPGCKAASPRPDGFTYRSGDGRRTWRRQQEQLRAGTPSIVSMRLSLRLRWSRDSVDQDVIRGDRSMRGGQRADQANSFTRLISTKLCRPIIWSGRSTAFSILIGTQGACALLNAHRSAFD